MIDWAMGMVTNNKVNIEPVCSWKRRKSDSCNLKRGRNLAHENEVNHILTKTQTQFFFTIGPHFVLLFCNFAREPSKWSSFSSTFGKVQQEI